MVGLGPLWPLAGLPFRQRCELCQRPATVDSGGLVGPTVLSLSLPAPRERWALDSPPPPRSRPPPRRTPVRWMRVWCAVREPLLSVVVSATAAAAAVFLLELIVLEIC